MKYSDWLTRNDVLNGIDANKEAGRPCCDTRYMVGGEVFFAMDNGKKHIEDAVKKGADVIVSDEPLPSVNVVVKEIRERYAAYCAEYYEHPERKIKLIAVTGTNGKTSIVKIISHFLKKAGKRVATIGTLGAEIGGEMIPTGMTTPDSDAFFFILKRAVNSGAEYVVMELSAHAIFLKKTWGVKYDVGVFSNLTQDHLDFFQNIQNYAKTKKSIFMGNTIKCAIINIDDNLGNEIFSERIGKKISYGIYEKCDIFASEINRTKSEYYVNNNKKKYKVYSPLYGEFNISNVLASIAASKEIGVNIDQAIRYLSDLPVIPGRFNVKNYRGITVILDYAHTPDGLEKVLRSAKEITERKLICLFGCGGNRDRSKRSIMGSIAEKYADFCVITSDNPRFEDPIEIIREIEKGYNGDRFVSITDRKEGIYTALGMAKNGDCVLIAGKGAEDYIEVKGEKIHFSDEETCDVYFEER